MRGSEQRDRFSNEAEALATGGEPVHEAETEQEQSVEVGAHERKKRGRKPPDVASLDSA
ncbi:peptidylprolyl isomerase [Caballeronia zhejiangensis]|uniref:Peptidylprolyl isomerase n=1 Tax=Caballeronia zhejiangensis TaxID=871203 RepID=A0A656QL02_9BURK|nr:peptidylprolyl isomerase [Caballeronia zhejiangensis]